jgi:hypothetical protein
MSQVIRVSKQGKNVMGTLTPNDYVFESSLNTFKILAQGTFSGTVSGTPTTFSLAHNRGVAPAVYGYAKFPDGYVVMPSGKERADTTGGPQRYYFVEVDSSNVYFSFYKGTTASYVPVVTYFVFETPI